MTDLPGYAYCGENISSNIPIPELPGGRAGKPIISFRLERPSGTAADASWSHHWLAPSGEKVISYRQAGTDHVLRFPGLADFLISEDAGEVVCTPLVGIPHETVRHVLIDQVLPRCLAHRGDFVLHASAVTVDHKLLLFTGPSQTGKSTLAASFHQAGYQAVCDDVVLIREEHGVLTALPSYAGLRLWPDSMESLFGGTQPARSMAHYSDKKRIELDSGAGRGPGQATPILAVIVLSPSGQDQEYKPRLLRLSLRQAYMELQEQSFLLDPADTDRIRSHVQALGRIARGLLTLQLTAPRDYGSLPTVRVAILERILQPAT